MKVREAGRAFLVQDSSEDLQVVRSEESYLNAHGRSPWALTGINDASTSSHQTNRGASSTFQAGKPSGNP